METLQFLITTFSTIYFWFLVRAYFVVNEKNKIEQNKLNNKWENI